MEKAQDLKCLNCDSERVVVGAISATGTGWPIFLADETKTGWVTVEHPGIPLNKVSTAVACLDCGWIRASLDKEEATRKLSKYGTDELKSRVGLD